MELEMFIEILDRKQLSDEELAWVNTVASEKGGEWEYVVVTSVRVTQSIWSASQPGYGVDVAELNRENLSNGMIAGLDSLIIPHLEEWYQLHFRGELSSVGIHYKGHIK